MSKNGENTVETGATVVAIEPQNPEKPWRGSLDHCYFVEDFILKYILTQVEAGWNHQVLEDEQEIVFMQSLKLYIYI